MIKLLLIDSEELLESYSLPYCESKTLKTFNEDEMVYEIKKYKQMHDGSEGVFAMAISTNSSEESEVYYSAFVNNSAFRTEENIKHILECLHPELGIIKYTVKLKGSYGNKCCIKVMSIEKFIERYEKIKDKSKWLKRYKIAFLNDCDGDLITFVSHSNFGRIKDLEYQIKETK